MRRIDGTFKELRRKGVTGLIPFLTVGFPELGATSELVKALVEGGADIVELGVPFSDPLADGATIQHASQVALENGVTTKACLDTVARLRQEGVSVPLVLMGYYNPFFRFGLDSFCRRASAVGVDGLIVADLPPEEADPLKKLCQAHNLDLIFLVAPTSTEERIERICRMASGFIYCVSLTGVTGAREALPATLPETLARVRKHTTLPLAVGFGISRREHVEAVGKHADAAIVGSALIQVLGSAPPQQRAAAARDYIAQLKGATGKPKPR